MRITGGTLKGRRLIVPGTGIRPTQDKVRHAFFSSTAGILEDCRFLDLFAGSGAVGIEALSRGAKESCFVEIDAKAVAVIHQNLKALGTEGERNIAAKAKILKRDVFRYVSNFSGQTVFDLIYADPPYFFGDTDGRTERLMNKISATRLLRDGGFFVIEQGVKNKIHEPAGWTLEKSAVYSQTRLCYYRNLGSGKSGKEET